MGALYVTIGKNAAFQKRPQLTFHEPGNNAIAAVPPFQESFQLFGDYTIKDAFFGITGAVCRSGFADGKARPERHEIPTPVLILLRDRRHIRLGEQVHSEVSERRHAKHYEE